MAIYRAQSHAHLRMYCIWGVCVCIFPTPYFSQFILELTPAMSVYQ